MVFFRYKEFYETNDPRYMRLVENNFVSMKVYIGDFSILKYTGVKKTLFFSFISSLGAGLNLWAGITIVFFVECIEVFVRIFSNNDKEVANKTDTNGKNNNNKNSSINSKAEQVIISMNDTIDPSSKSSYF